MEGEALSAPHATAAELCGVPAPFGAASAGASALEAHALELESLAEHMLARLDEIGALAAQARRDAAAHENELAGPLARVRDALVKDFEALDAKLLTLARLRDAVAKLERDVAAAEGASARERNAERLAGVRRGITGLISAVAERLPVRGAAGTAREAPAGTRPEEDDGEPTEGSTEGPPPSFLPTTARQQQRPQQQDGGVLAALGEQLKDAGRAFSGGWRLGR